MMRDAESHAADDAKKREEIEARNHLDGLIYQMEKTLNENREKVGAVAGEVETAIADAKKALAEGGVERMNEAFNATANGFAQDGRSALSADARRQERRRRLRIKHRQPELRLRAGAAAKTM